MQEYSNSKYDIIFVGLVRNCEQYLNFFFKHVKKISNKYKVKIILGENNSTDYSFDIIHKNILSLDIDFIDTTFIEKFSNRITRLSKARQAIKDFIKNKNIFSKYVFVIDLDDVIKNKNISNLSYKMIDLLEKNKNNYFCVSAKSKPYYYDILNFESDQFPNEKILDLMLNKSLFSYTLRYNKIYRVQKILSLQKDFNAKSSFNGMCIYFFKDYIKADYINNSNSEVIPEHLNLNRKIAINTNKKILVSQDIVLNMPKEHEPLFNFFSFLLNKVEKYLKIFFN